MKLPKLSYIPQSVVPNQRDDERVFVIARRQLISFMIWEGVTVILAIIPLLFAILSFDGLIALLASLPAIIDDLLIFLLMAYYLTLLVVFMTNWANYYYNYLVVTDQRVFISGQVGFFNRLPYEFTLEEVQEATFRARGFIGIVLNIGDIMVHFEGSAQRDYKIQSVLNTKVISALISSLAEQAKGKISPEQRFPETEIVAIIENTKIFKQGPFPPVMNCSKSIKQAQRKIASSPTSKPSTLRNKFDLWWWTQLKKEHILYIDYSPADIKSFSSGGGEDDRGQKNKDC